jgi:hypothetical protein
MKNATSHTAMAMQEFLEEKQITPMPQPPHVAALFPLRLLALPQTKSRASGSMLCDTQKHEMQCDSQPLHHTKEGFP